MVWREGELRRIFAALTAMVCALPCAAAPTCGAGLRGAHELESGHYRLAYRTQPAKIAVGRHFSIEIALCAKGNAPAPAGMAVDAFMPEHGHGMNYQATVKPVVDNKSALKPLENRGARYRADGLMFHMPGRWELTFEVQGAGGTERLTRSVVLE